MHITFSTGSLSGYSLSSIFGIAQRVGADGLELMLTSGLLKYGPEHVQSLEHEFGVPVRSVHTVRRLRRPGPGRAAEDIVASARFAGALGHCAVLVVHAPDSPGLHSPEARAWIGAIESAREIGEDALFRVAIENHGQPAVSGPPSFLDHPERLRWLAAEWGIGITFDTAHAANQGWDIVATAARLRAHLENVHLSDYGRRSYRSALANALLRDHQLPGTGTLPLESMIQSLAGSGYRGLVTLDVSPLALGALWRWPVEGLLRQAIASCRVGETADRPSAEQSKHPGLP
jgi:sugar phosphate isomerase/epimerase